jgi:NADPH:quinone reductase-like Zn-dependent oxidoreductase
VRRILPVVPAERIVTVADFEAMSLGATLTMGPGPLELFADSFRDVLPLAAQGKFTTEIAAEFPLTELAAAQKMSEDGHFRGKILVVVADLD